MKNLIQEIEPDKTIFLEYPVSLTPRYTTQRYHKGIAGILEKNHNNYQSLLHEFLGFSAQLLSIAIDKLKRKELKDPIWINGYLPGLDTVGLYCMVVINKPRIYLEVGSGNSTKVARKAILDNNLESKIWSIDPAPRAEINDICDHIIRKPLEHVDLNIFKELSAGDILFIDNSHRVFMNSDVTAFFLDILPIIEKRVIIQIHDVLLPFDYPEEWAQRFYSEQYMLAMLLLFASNNVEIILPNYYVSQTTGLADILDPFWNNPKLAGVERHGGSFWFKMK
ncbi:class I SAM-dependent methyltransferase [Lunatimonas lonarensis]|nr:class I SAM-dependent methyltransferase [Lunatimonas lonarensis]